LILFSNKIELQNNFLDEVLTGKKEVIGIEELIKERLRFEGCEEVREEGIAIGMEEEIEEELLKAVSNMIKKGFSDQDIIEILDISKDKLTLLRKQIGN
jgi:hypothetical protein